MNKDAESLLRSTNGQLLIVWIILQLDFWTQPNGIGHPVDVQVPPEYLSVLKEIFDENDLKYYTMVDDLQEWVLMLLSHLCVY